MPDGTLRQCGTCHVMLVLRNGVWLHDYENIVTNPWRLSRKDYVGAADS